MSGDFQARLRRKHPSEIALIASAEDRTYESIGESGIA